MGCWQAELSYFRVELIANDACIVQKEPRFVMTTPLYDLDHRVMIIGVVLDMPILNSTYGSIFTHGGVSVHDKDILWLYFGCDNQ